MTVGIYLLRFEGTDKVYVGQSRNIEKRVTKHFRDLKAREHSYKLQKAFSTYGMPIYEIVAECSIEELDTLEIEAVAIFDSINNGFNSMEAGEYFPIFIGEKNAQSLYSDEDIEWIFNYLIDNPEMSLITVSENTGVHRSTLKNINNGYSHKWLEDRFPERYKILMGIKRAKLVNTLKYSGKPLPVAISPEGEEFIIENITKFAKDHGLNRGAFGNMLRGNAKQHKGWYSGGFI